MIEYTEIQGDVVGVLEIDEDDATRFLFDENLAIAQLHVLNTVKIDFLTNAVTTTKFNLSNGVALYQYPDDYIRFVKLWLDFSAAITATNEGREAIPYDPEKHAYKNIGSVATTRYPFIDLQVEGGIGIYPVPTADVTNGARLRYVWKLPNPTSSQDCLLEYNLKNLLVHKTVTLCALVDNFNVELSKAHAELYNAEAVNFLPKKGRGEK